MILDVPWNRIKLYFKEIYWLIFSKRVFMFPINSISQRQKPSKLENNTSCQKEIIGEKQTRLKVIEQLCIIFGWRSKHFLFFSLSSQDMKKLFEMKYQYWLSLKNFNVEYRNKKKEICPSFLLKMQYADIPYNADIMQWNNHTNSDIFSVKYN